ncbi:MAG: class C sortase [Clostridiaceae bacterium]|nr:class C sortase [Clostridiaceae bacterium]
MSKTKKTKNKRAQRILIFFVFLIGLAIFSYPLFSRWYYQIDANQEVLDFRTEQSKLDEVEIEERLALAQAYNDSLVNYVAADPYEKERLDQGLAEYARMLELHEKIGIVEIPSISVNLPVYAGTSEIVLQKGVGHLEGTSLPIGGKSSHTVLTAHSGLPEAKLFSELEKMEIGDIFYIHNLGMTLAYEVDNILVIEPSNFEDLLIVQNQDYATLLTCTPIMINSHRLIVRGHRIAFDAGVRDDLIDSSKNELLIRRLLTVALILIVIFLILIYRERKTHKKLITKLNKINNSRDI